MSDAGSAALPASGTVHWIGTGLSTGSGLRVLTGAAPRVLVWGRTTERARQTLDRLGLAGRAEPKAFEMAGLAGQLRAGDTVVSMLPAAEHPALVRLCAARHAHFACSSYVSEPILDAVPAAERAGVVVLTEAGLDPGIDHLFATLLVRRARAAIGAARATAEFTSYCGGVPAVANEFRYRFSWAPRGVLTALCAPARYVERGVTTVVDFPWEATRPHVLDGETFEVYPNRDSVPFIDQYALPPTWRIATFVRGTLRLDGWRQAWTEVFAELKAATADGDSARIATLAAKLAARHPTTAADRDRVVLSVALRLRADDGTAWSGQYLLDAAGERAESAMARCVSLPLAFGVTEILAGRMAPGLRRAADDPAEAQRWLSFLGAHGIHHRFSA